MEEIAISDDAGEVVGYNVFNYKGKKYMWKLIRSPADTRNYTVIHDGFTLTRKKKFWLLGPEITVRKPKEIFTMAFDITDPLWNKSYVVKELHERIDRYEEIKRGEIV